MKINFKLIEIFAYCIILISGFIVSYHLIVNEINSCTSNPGNYLIENIKKNSNAENVYGTITLSKSKPPAISTFYFGDEKDIDDKISKFINQTNFTIKK